MHPSMHPVSNPPISGCLWRSISTGYDTSSPTANVTHFIIYHNFGSGKSPLAMRPRQIFLLSACLISRTFGHAMQEGDTGGTKGVALTPPMGFNSYDSYDWTMNETELMRSAQAMQKLLLPSGYNTLTLDWYWYRDGRQITRTLPKVGLPTNTSVQIFFDEFGRVYPDPHRFPSTAASKGWRPVLSAPPFFSARWR